jgi:hypothetical protein
MYIAMSFLFFRKYKRHLDLRTKLFTSSGRKLWRKLSPFLSLSAYFWNKSVPDEKTQRPDPANELYLPSDRRLSVKLVPTFADRGYHVARVNDPYGRIFGLLDRLFQTKAATKRNSFCWTFSLRWLMDN